MEGGIQVSNFLGWVATFVGYAVLFGGAAWAIFGLYRFVTSALAEEKRYKTRIATLEVERSNLEYKIYALSSLTGELSKKNRELLEWAREVSVSGMGYDIQPAMERSQAEWDSFVRSLERDLRASAREVIAQVNKVPPGLDGRVKTMLERSLQDVDEAEEAV